MDIWNLASLLCFLLMSLSGDAEKVYDPMVAFVCNKGAMHMDPENGWTSDERVDCLEGKENILDYCRTVYPHLDVENIVENTEHMAINGWCALGDKNCASPDTFSVQPYRCLAGAFQSDALIVPEGCKFDHIYEEDTCKDFSYWHNSVTRKCTEAGDQVLDSYGMLMPCGTDIWSGVEYVCCPQESSAKPAAMPKAAAIPKPAADPKPAANSKPAATPMSTDSSDSDKYFDIVSKYLHMQLMGGEYKNEHDVFELVKKEEEDMNRDKMTKLLKEWGEARDRVVKLKSVDSKQAEQLNSEITGRYEKEYLALQRQGEREEIQIDTVHQQHVDTNFNYKKRVAMQKLMEQLQAQVYDVEDITTLLHNYISIEEKDAVHCVRHYIKVRARDPHAAQEMKPATIEHLTLISLRINQSIDLLDTLKDRAVVDRLKNSTRTWMRLSSFNISRTIKSLRALPDLQEQTTQKMDIHDVVNTVSVPRVVTAAPQTPSNVYIMYANKLPTGTEKHEERLLPVKSDEETTSVKTDTFVGVKVVNTKDTIVIGKELSVGAVIALSTGLIAAMMVVVLVVLLVKKKTGRRSRKFTNTYLEVSSHAPDISPEDRHIVAMQNGYENPTYALLEQRNL